MLHPHGEERRAFETLAALAPLEEARRVSHHDGGLLRRPALTDAPSATVEIEGVSKRFGRTLALDNVSFEVRSNELIALLGPNGAGKTTLLHILCTILRPDSGTARINGADVIKNPLQARRHLGRRLPGTESRRPAHAVRELELPRPRLRRSGRAA